MVEKLFMRWTVGKEKMGIIKKQLKEAEIGLLKICHDKDCSNVYFCPDKHSLCKEQLGLHTAIAWSLGQDIQSLFIEAKTYFTSDFITIKQDSYLRYHYHKLADKINEISWILKLHIKSYGFTLQPIILRQECEEIRRLVKQTQIIFVHYGIRSLACLFDKNLINPNEN